MARFYGQIGYGTAVENPAESGKWVDEVIELPFFGDLVRNTRTLNTGDSVNDDISVGNSVSIVADAYARGHIFAMRYVKWRGGFWKITSVEENHPRLLLQLGGVYNGPKA